MKKTIGYGWKLKSESIGEGMRWFLPNQWLATKKEAERDIKAARGNFFISMKVKVQIFKVVVEVL
jgi:hypothetical protein